MKKLLVDFIIKVVIANMISVILIIMLWILVCFCGLVSHDYETFKMLPQFLYALKVHSILNLENIIISFKYNELTYYNPIPLIFYIASKFICYKYYFSLTKLILKRKI
jgi:hypothetical protein